MLAQQLIFGYQILELVLFSIIVLSGVVGAFFAATTRDDAYTAGDRQSKLIWVAILVASAFVVFTRVPFLSWAGMVAIGVYWFDVRPHLRSLVSGNGGW
ncbi:DUF2516 family protein [Corynebacterium suedekumii]|uniref:DUF2516 family protein n=1 Tax=Corynebacterium suedekumii TaxID=3049801 RepID=A0ABY8VPD9_9CORY|nr:DUF2516 family protein [Corynebacterium suedekumii]WIM71217.1 DUF2516 family protein [Corynebacterium suedekumii]